jgi:GT2 family glycosyltransferase
MKPLTLISVVTSTYNGASYLEKSLQSVLDQQGVEIELIVVDDGSTDDSSEIIGRLARKDNRVRLFSQENQGLTRALIRGCAEVRGAYIARHDSDDVSLPGRLETQVTALSNNTALTLVSCYSQATGPRDEPLYVSGGAANPDEAMRHLRAGKQGPAGHGSTMFRAETYRSVGGYRPEFRYSQDWDLWLRLTEKGEFAFVPEIFYCYRIGEASISANRRTQQSRLGHIAMQCAQARLAGASESSYLEEATRISAEIAPMRRDQSNSYFIASCLLKKGDLRGLLYLWNAFVAPLRR